MKEWEQIQRALQYAAQNPEKNIVLRELAAAARQSPFHLHRRLRSALRETPKSFTLRLRVDRAAAALLSTRQSILDIALANGFESHESFCRAFRRRFRMSPTIYRKRGLNGPGARRHAELVAEIGPCVGLYRLDLVQTSSRTSMNYTIERRILTAQPILVVRRRVPRSAIAATIGAELPKVFLHAQQHGIAISGYPITRYPEITVGMMTIETGMRVASHSGTWTDAEGGGDVLAETLPAGPAAVTVHAGPYDQLHDAYVAVEEWIRANGFRAAGAPWEVYLNDPADHPDPQDWKTEVYWPLES